MMHNRRHEELERLTAGRGAHGAEWVVVAAAFVVAITLGYGVHTLLALLGR